MWMVKGIALGGGIFFVGAIVYLSFVFFSGPAHATGLTAIKGMTTANPFFWLALVGCLLIGISAVASWPVRIPS